MFIRIFAVACGLLCFSPALHSQMEHMDHDMHGMTMQMSSAIVPTVPMGRDGSGTSWLPDNSPMYAFHSMLGSWSAMLHGEIFPRYTAQDAFKTGSRGGSRFDAPNWVMGMISHSVGSTGQIAFRAMMSLDRLTEGGQGYPLLFQTGESWNGHPLVDNQHPHDLVMELATAVSLRIGSESAVYIYAGLPGEPALGPPVFMHRPSAWEIPDAPISHHWQDATHITFGVATLGWQYHDFKIEGSAFNGREPDENRYNFDTPRIDSYSARLSFNPTDELALQISRGYLKGPEQLEPGVDLFRTTASVVYQRHWESNAYWCSTIVWGMNSPLDEQSLQSVLFESDLRVGKQSVFGRFEGVEKSAVELDLTGNSHRIYRIGGLTLGTSRVMASGRSFELALGAQGSVYAFDHDLQSLYGTTPVSLEIFLRLSPPLAHMDHMEGMHE